MYTHIEYINYITVQNSTVPYILVAFQAIVLQFIYPPYCFLHSLTCTMEGICPYLVYIIVVEMCVKCTPSHCVDVAQFALLFPLHPPHHNNRYNI